MDYVQKKVFEAQVKKVGKDLGIGSSLPSGFPGASHERERQSRWSVFPSRINHDAEVGAPAAEESERPSVALANVFESQPKNFPPLLNLFYVDQSILSETARNAVTYAFHVLCAAEVLLALNVFASALFSILLKGKVWIDAIISVCVAILLTGFELAAFETAFRGAYRTSTNLRQRYLFFATANIVIFFAYAFIGESFFNGWASVRGLGEDEEHRNLQMTFVMIEALGWTTLSFFNIHVLFAYYHLFKGKDEGLSASAREAAASATTSIPNDHIAPEGSPDSDRAGRRDVRIQALRDKYLAPRQV